MPRLRNWSAVSKSDVQFHGAAGVIGSRKKIGPFFEWVALKRCGDPPIQYKSAPTLHPPPNSTEAAALPSHWLCQKRKWNSVPNPEVRSIWADLRRSGPVESLVRGSQLVDVLNAHLKPWGEGVEHLASVFAARTICRIQFLYFCTLIIATKG